MRYSICMDGDLTNVPDKLESLNVFLADRESAHNLKPGTEARIEWNCGSELQKTEYAIIYLHGFRASHPEGDPVHRKVAEHFGYNLFLSRLEEHGIQTDYPLLNLSEEKLLQSARFALHIGQKIGRKVIVMGTSTGGSLGLWLASRNEFKDQISSLILYSPLIRFYGINQHLLTNFISRQSLRLFLGKNFLIKNEESTEAEDRIWNKEYALQGALVLGSFIRKYMQNSTFSQVDCPVFVGYYYKNKEEQDKVVSVHAIKKMVSQLGTRTASITSMNFLEANSHVICSSLLSKAVINVTGNTIKFLKSIDAHSSTEI